MSGFEAETWLADPAQACEGWPIRADWAFQEGGLKETLTPAIQRMNKGAAAKDHKRKKMFLNSKRTEKYNPENVYIWDL